MPLTLEQRTVAVNCVNDELTTPSQTLILRQFFIDHFAQYERERYIAAYELLQIGEWPVDETLDFKTGVANLFNKNLLLDSTRRKANTFYVANEVNPVDNYIAGRLMQHFEHAVYSTPQFKPGDRVMTDDPDYPGTVVDVSSDGVCVDWDFGDKNAWHAFDPKENPDEQVHHLPKQAKQASNDVIIRVVFEESIGRSYKVYEYLCDRALHPYDGDVFFVDTPYGKNKRIIVKKVVPLSEQTYRGKLKRVDRKLAELEPDNARDRGTVIHLAMERLTGGKPDAFSDGLALDLKTFAEAMKNPKPIAWSGRLAQTLAVADAKRITFLLNDTPNQETPMRPFQLLNKTFVTGGSFGSNEIDVAKLSDAQLFQHIADVQDQIDALRKQNEKTQSNKLSKQIEALEAGVVGLRELVDARDPQ